MLLTNLIRRFAQLCIGLGLIAIGVLSIIGIDAMPGWPWLIPAGAILLSGVVMMGGRAMSGD